MRRSIVSIAMLIALASATSGVALSHEAQRPAQIRTGSCASTGDVVARLDDLAVPTGASIGSGSALGVESSSTSVDLALSSLLADEHSIVIGHAADDADALLACGDVGGVAGGPDGALAVGLAPVGASTFSGIGILREEPGGGTTVEVYISELRSDHATGGTATLQVDRAGGAGDFGTPGEPRDIALAMTDSLRFFPDTIVVRQGETVRFLLDNPTDVTHDFTLGDLEAQMHHHEEMAAGGGHDHTHGSASGGIPAPVMLEPGASVDVVATFNEAGVVLMGCHVPGHWEAGMQGTIIVEPMDPAG